MTWTIQFSKKAEKQTGKLNEKVQSALRLLAEDLKEAGPGLYGKQWPNHKKFKGVKRKDQYHCHLIKGKPTYVCCWEVMDKIKRILEVYYVGTHEGAPY